MAEKFRMFYNVHKGLRNALFTTTILAGETDFNNPAELEKLEKAWGNTFSFLDFHGHHEDRHCNEPLEAKAPGSAKYCMDEHIRIDKKIDNLNGIVAEMRTATDAEERAELGYKFYHDLNLFISEYIHHMWDEEANLSNVFMQYYTVGDIMQMEANIVASLSPEEKAIGMQYMLPAMTKNEIAEFLGGIRNNAPAPAYNGMVEAASRILPSEKWQPIEAKLQEEYR